MDRKAVERGRQDDSELTGKEKSGNKNAPQQGL